jgi:uncharacterized protein (DUF2147 family)
MTFRDRRAWQGRHVSAALGSAIAAAMLWLAPGALAQTGGGILGRWLTANHHAVIQIGPCGKTLCGRLDWLYQPIRHGAPAMDEKNPDASRRAQPLCGLAMLYDFKPDPSDPRHWEGGYIYDPESGSTYHAEMTLVDRNHLHLRGYIGIPLFGRTQTWTRVTEGYPVCKVG